MIHTYIKVYLLKNIVGLLVLTMFFSCEEAAKKSADSQEKIPNGETYNFRLIYTDSTKVRTVLESALNKDFSTQKFPYTEFPKGLVLKLYDEQAHENIIKARYGIYYLPTQMVMEPCRLSIYSKGCSVNTQSVLACQKSSEVLSTLPS